MSPGSARKADTGKIVWHYQRRRPERPLLYQLASLPVPIHRRPAVATDRLALTRSGYYG